MFFFAPYVIRGEHFILSFRGFTEVEVVTVGENVHAEVSRSENKQKILRSSRCGRGSESTAGSRIRKGGGLFGRL